MISAGFDLEAGLVWGQPLSLLGILAFCHVARMKCSWACLKFLFHTLEQPQPVTKKWKIRKKVFLFRSGF